MIGKHKFQVLLCITKNSMTLVTCLHTVNDQAVLFHTIQFIVSYLFASSLNDKQFYLTHM